MLFTVYPHCNTGTISGTVRYVLERGAANRVCENHGEAFAFHLDQYKRRLVAYMRVGYET